MINITAAKPRASALATIVYGGFAIGVLDFLDASIFFPLYFGISFTDVWHGPASGVLGRESAEAGGQNTALLGIFLHFVVAFCIAAVYYILTRCIPWLLRNAVVSGILYGVAAHFVMQYGVIPLSAISAFPRWPPSPVPFANSIVGHALLVGLPVALIAAWSARNNT